MSEANVLGPVPPMLVLQPSVLEDSVPFQGKLPAVGSMTPFKWITGAQERTSVASPSSAPWNAIGLLNLAMHGQVVLVGTGFMCAPDVFLTARHNLTTKSYDAAGVWVAYDDKRNRSAQVAIKARAWHSSLDLAVLILARSQTSTIPLGGPPPARVSIGGYGIPYADGTMRLSSATGAISGPDGLQVGYAVNTQEGDSGAPVLAQGPGGAFSAVAVHTTSEGGLLNSNFGTLLTPNAIGDIGQLIAFARKHIQGE